MATPTYTDGNWGYDLSDSNAIIINYTGSAGDITIPSTVGGYPVIQVGVTSGSASDVVFPTNLAEFSVIIPEGVQVIGKDAFLQCENLKSVSLPSTLTEIKGEAFVATGLTEVIIPSNVASIGFNAFAGCPNITKIVFNSNSAPEEIGSDAFAIGYDTLVTVTVYSKNNWASSVLDEYKDQYTTFVYVNSTYKKLIYDSSKVQVESAIRDGDGVKISTNYAKKSDVGIQLEDTSVTFNLQAVPDYADYPYRGAVENARITEDTYVTITYSDDEAISGLFAPFCETAAGILYLYASSPVGTVIIPTINIGGGPMELTVDAVPTDGSTNPVSSNGVYDAINQANILLENTQVTFSANSGDFSTDYPYVATVTSQYITANTFATVGFSDAQIKSGNYAPFCMCDVVNNTGTLFIYAKADVGTVTIPTIKFGIEGRIINIDSAPTEGSSNFVTSGGVYDNCVRTTGNQYIGGVKAFTDSVVIEKGLPDLYMDNTSDDYTQANTSVDTKNYFAFRDKNNNATFHISEYTYNGGRAVAMTVSNKASGTVDTSEINIHNPDSGSSFVTAPYRSFSPANTLDVVTVGSLAPVDLTSQVTADGNSGTFNKTYSSVIKSGNVVLITIGGSNMGQGLNNSYYLYGLPKAFKRAYAPIYDHAKQKFLGFLQIYEGETILRATTFDSGVSNAITMQMTYITCA